MTLKIKEQLEWLLMCICTHYQNKTEYAHSKNRLRENVMCRQIFYHLAFELYPKKFSLKMMSKHFFNQHHTTIIYSIKNIKGFLERDLVLQDDINEIKKNFFKETKKWKYTNTY